MFATNKLLLFFAQWYCVIGLFCDYKIILKVTLGFLKYQEFCIIVSKLLEGMKDPICLTILSVYELGGL